MMKRAPDNVRYLPAGPQSRARRSRDCVVLIGRPSRADCGDRLPFDRQIDIAAIEMGLCRFVPDDESGGVANDFPRHGWFVRIRHGISSKQSPLRSANAAPRSSIGLLNLASTTGLALIGA